MDENITNNPEYAAILKRRREAAAEIQSSINTPLNAPPPKIILTPTVVNENDLEKHTTIEEKIDEINKVGNAEQEAIKELENYVQVEGSVKTTEGEVTSSIINVETAVTAEMILDPISITMNIEKSKITSPEPELTITENNVIVEGTPPEVPNIKDGNPTAVAVTENVVISTYDEDDSVDTEQQPDIDNGNDIVDENVDVSIDTSTIEIDTNETKEDTTTEEPAPLIKVSEPVRIGTVGETNNKKRIASLNPGPNIKVVNSEDFQKAVIEQYITKTSGDSFVGPKSVSRVVLPYSGIYIDISSYTNTEMLGIHRSTTDISFVEKIEKELISAYEHTTSNSFKRKLEFPEWLRSIKYPDLWCIYWGIYNVNHPGVNVYKSKCDNCPNIVEEKRDNYQITYISPNSEEDIDRDSINRIRNGAEREFIHSYNVAHTLIERADYLPESKIKVFFGMPNLEEVMLFMKYLKVDLEEEDQIIRRVLHPLSHLEMERNELSKGTISKLLTYKYMMYVRKLYVPVYEQKKEKEGVKIKVTYVDADPIMIYPILNDLSSDDFKAMVKSNQLRKLMLKEGIHFRVKDSVCPKCKSEQLVTALDMRDIIFTRAEALAESLMSI